MKLPSYADSPLINFASFQYRESAIIPTLARPIRHATRSDTLISSLCDYVISVRLLLEGSYSVAKCSHPCLNVSYAIMSIRDRGETRSADRIPRNSKHIHQYVRCDA